MVQPVGLEVHKDRNEKFGPLGPKLMPGGPLSTSLTWSLVPSPIFPCMHWIQLESGVHNYCYVALLIWPCPVNSGDPQAHKKRQYEWVAYVATTVSLFRLPLVLIFQLPNNLCTFNNRRNWSGCTAKTHPCTSKCNMSWPLGLLHAYDRPPTSLISTILNKL